MRNLESDDKQTCFEVPSFPALPLAFAFASLFILPIRPCFLSVAFHCRYNLQDLLLFNSAKGQFLATTVSHLPPSAQPWSCLATSSSPSKTGTTTSSPSLSLHSTHLFAFLCSNNIYTAAGSLLCFRFAYIISHQTFSNGLPSRIVNMHRIRRPY